MKLKMYACLLLVGGVVAANPAMAAPQSVPFLSVDFNGYNAGNPADPQLGPTEPGFGEFRTIQGFDQLDPNYDPNEDFGNSGLAGLTRVFSTAEGNITVNLSGRGSGSRIARNRNAMTSAYPLGAMYQDIAFMTRNLDGFGQNWLRLHISGLVPGQAYEFTGFAYEPFNGNTGEMDTSYQGWTDIDTLGGLDGPGAWMDTNVGANAVYLPTYQPDTMAPDYGVYKNPIPTILRARISGPNPTMANPYEYGASFVTTASAGGTITVYTWADPQSFSGTQTATALNGFQLGIAIPEPASLILLGLGLISVVGRRRRIS